MAFVVPTEFPKAVSLQRIQSANPLPDTASSCCTIDRFPCLLDSPSG